MKRMLFVLAVGLIGLTASAQEPGLARLRLAQASAPAAPAPAAAPAPTAPIAGVPVGNCAGCEASAGSRVGSVAAVPCTESDGRFGLHPFFRRLAFWRPVSACAQPPRILGPFGGLLGGNAAGQAYVRERRQQYVTPGAEMPGTLVFPHYQYVRSPRDFFMQDPR
jgi:hypothetical protein